MRPVKSVALAGMCLAVSAVTAAAQIAPALVTRDVNLRAQPTTHSFSFGIIPGGSTVNAGPCGGGWCQALAGGQSGFIYQAFLDFGGPPPFSRMYGPPPPTIYGPPRPPVVYGPPPPMVYGPPPRVVYGPPPPPVFVPAPVIVRPRPWPWWW
jgi:hypothetical protein